MSDKYRFSSNYHPPCSGRFGSFTEPDPLVCCGKPGHHGAHHNRAGGSRWGFTEQRTTPCPWKGCADPMRVEEDGAHLCPGGEGERRYGHRPAP